MPHTFRTSAATAQEFYKGQHRFEHWYRDNTVYFITSRCRHRSSAFDSDEAKLIFWDRFTHYAAAFRFIPWVTTLLNNHYHTLGYLRVGDSLGPLMRRLHGSVAKLVNDLLPERHLPFWRRAGNQDYFDGCIRDLLQARRAYRYTLMQAVPAGLVGDYRAYPHTRVNVEMDRGIACAVELNALLKSVPYAGQVAVTQAGSIRKYRHGLAHGERGLVPQSVTSQFAYSSLTNFLQSCSLV